MRPRSLEYGFFLNILLVIEFHKSGCFLLTNLSWKLKWAFLIVCRRRLYVRPFVKFTYYRHLLKNHWANFNQTWHKASLGDMGIEICLNEGPALLKGR